MCLNSPDNHAVQYGDLTRVGRGLYRLARDGERGTVPISRPDDVPKAAEVVAAPHEEWFWEGNVQAAVVRHIAAEGWDIRRVADTASRERGVDIEESRSSPLERDFRIRLALLTPVRTIVRTGGEAMKTKDRRREFRLSAEDEQLITEAAALAGVSFTGFVLDEALARAREIVESHRTITLPEEAYERFLEALDAPPERNPALVELAKRAKRFRRVS